MKLKFTRGPRIHSRKAGLPPGTLVYSGEREAQAPRITILDYNPDEFTERQVEKPEECFSLRDSGTVSWINVDGFGDVSVIEKLGNHFGMHPLAQEDILNTGQRPSFDDYEKYLFLMLKMLTYNSEQQRIETEHVSMVLGKGFVISFQERPGDVFEQIRSRIRNDKGRIRKMSADYLCYCLIDAIVDNYFVVLENLSEQIESLEQQVMHEPSEQTLTQIYMIKREMITLRRSIWPLREVVNGIQRNEPGLIGSATQIYLRDVYDHTIQVIDTVESYRDMVSGLLDIYLSSVSNRMNEVMKVLTIIATIFIPLTFVAGIYGMNFETMPELQWQWGYPAVLVVMLVIAIIMLIYFRKKKWL